MFKTKFSMHSGAIALTLGAFVFFTACNKKDKNVSTSSEDTGYATDHITAEKSYSDVQTITDQASNVNTGGNIGYKGTELTSSPCARVTKSSDSIVIDFGSTDCLCLDGRYRRGKIICVYTGRYADSGSVHTITFDNYYQDYNQITGTKVVTNMGNNASNQPYFTVVINSTITKPSGATIVTNWNRVRTWTAGYNTLGNITDDVYSITGSGTITRSTGGVVSVNIPTSAPLIVAHGCKWIEAGTINYTLASGATRSIDFGTTPSCNATATVTWSGGSRVITLP